MTTSRRSLASLVCMALGSGATGAWLMTWWTSGTTASLCPSPAQTMQRIELVFGLSRRGQPDLDDAAWQLFLDREVTPRFPDGLTALRASGQWRGASGPAIKEPARLLLIWARPNADLDQRIEAVRTAWKIAHRQDSVLSARAHDCVSF